MAIFQTIKNVFSGLMIFGVLCPVILSIFNITNQLVFLLSIIGCSMVGTGILFGFSNFRTIPRNVGNLNNRVKPDINQTWLIFLIGLVFNLLTLNFIK